MLNIPVVEGLAAARSELRRLFAGATFEEFAAEEAAAREIVASVRARGDDAVLEYERKFGWAAITAEQIEVGSAERAAAEAAVSAEFLAAAERAAERIRDFHRRQVRQSWWHVDDDGTLLGQRYTAVERVGLYVPGGKAPYPSTVLMTAIPARVAGVEHLAMCTPADREGEVDPHILTAARLAGVDTIYRVGGAHGIAALAFGTGAVKRVDKIVGPGNIYVTLAKKIVYGDCGIEGLPGPSEVIVVADATANPCHVAADLMAQAEHGGDSSAILITSSKPLAQTVLQAVERELATMPRRDYIEQSLSQRGAVVIVASLDEAFALSNERAPEHLLILTEDPMQHLSKVRNAGAIFLGAHSTVPFGDYLAGPSHVLPTGTTARFASGIGVDDFIKRSSVVCYSEPGMRRAVPDLTVLAGVEGFVAHAAAGESRLGDES